MTRDLLGYSAFACTCINIWNWINKMLTVSVVSVCYTPGHFKDTGKTNKHKERKVQPLHHSSHGFYKLAEFSYFFL